MRLVLIDDDPLVDLGLASVLRTSGFDVTGTASDLPSGIEAILRDRPDVVVCDVMIGGAPAGLDLIPGLAATDARGTPVVYLSSFAPQYLVDTAHELGAAGYLTKDTDLETLVAAIRIATAGGQVFPVRKATIRAPSPREIQVIRLIADGYSTEEIAQRMTLSSRTVEMHLSRLYERYAVASRTQLAILAVRKGWISELPG